ncbi:AAA family ATPase [Patescibacteria group bacterium AH-259-L05]|nr:AAA family ATPase [Patescibacteria group bacterium AH-259-L05]
MEKRKERIPRLVLTGGPCAGKTTALSMLTKKLKDYGVTPFLVPEVATLAITSGVNIGAIITNRTAYFDFEQQLLLAQLALEDQWEEFLRILPGENKVLICDRGVMDVAAYMDQKEFAAMIQDLGFQLSDLRDKRYDSVFHLVTAAEGAEEFYNYDNPARYETAEQAREADKKTLAAWTGHERLRIIHNVTITREGGQKRKTFSEKMDELLRAICRTLHIPVPLEIERKFLIHPKTDPNNFPVSSTITDIRQTYLSSSDDSIETRIRESRPLGKSSFSFSDGAVYTFTEKTRVSSRTRQETERIISAREYLEFLKQKDTHRKTIVKKRYSFAYKHQYFQLDIFVSPQKLIILEVELTEEQDQLLLPSFLTIIKEVTEDERYCNASIAAGNCPGYRNVCKNRVGERLRHSSILCKWFARSKCK